MEKFKKIIIFIGIITIILIIICSLLVINKEDNKIEEEILSNEPTEKPSEKNQNGFAVQKDANFFYSIVGALNRYITVLQMKQEDFEENEYNIKNEEERNEAIFEMLDKNYVKDNKITDENLVQYINEFSSEVNAIPIDMRVKYGEKIQTYILSVYLENVDTKELMQKYFVIRVDNLQGAFSVQPCLDNFEEYDIDTLPIDENVDEIKKGDYNIFLIQKYSTERLITEYIDNYINLALNHPEIVYNSYLDDEYKQKRFGSVDEFKKYVSNNKDEIANIKIDKYSTERNGEINEYICIDKNGNYYIISETAINNYKIRLDTYTIMSEKFETEYNKVDDQHKVMMNIDKWVQMLNNRDYKAAYEVLDKTFREDNFGTADDFEEYMRTIYPYFYDLEFGELEEEEGLYIQEITLKNKNDVTDNGRGQHIIMQLEEGTTNFVMSFRRVNR